MVNSNMFKNILIKSKFWWDLYVLMFLVMGYYHFIDPTQFYFYFLISSEFLITFVIIIRKKMLNDLKGVISLFTTIAILITIPFMLIFCVRYFFAPTTNHIAPIVKCTTDVRSGFPNTHTCIYMFDGKQCHMPYKPKRFDVERWEIPSYYNVKIEAKVILPHLYYICNRQFVKKEKIYNEK